MIERDEDVSNALSNSILLRAPFALADGVSAAWRHSSMVRALGPITAVMSALDRPRRLRFGALTIAWAAIVHLGIRNVLPLYVVSGLPWWWNALVAAVALAISAYAEAIVSAWPSSALSRAWRRLTA
jgi:hypothetical protein